MADVEDIEDPPAFKREDWIGQGKKITDVPIFVLNACTNAFAIPAEHKSHFPSNNITVSELLTWDLPSQSSAFITTKAETWFSTDPPRARPDQFIARPMPNDAFLDKLTRLARQAWLDGAQSFIDTRYNDGQDRGPLEMVEYWKEMNRVVKGRAKWKKCENWLATGPNDRTHNADTTRTFDSARAILPTLGWDTPVSGLGRGQTTLTFTSLLGTDWIGEGVVQMMVEQLSESVRMSAAGSKMDTLVAGVQFARALEDAATKKCEYGRTTTPILSRYEAHIDDADVKHLYFPAHVHGSHWIAVHIDFTTKEVSYGEL